MNTPLRTAILSLSVLGLAGCAGMQDRPDSAAYAPPQRAPSSVHNDALYMAQVERIARRRGIDLVWVNPPRRHVAATTGD